MTKKHKMTRHPMYEDGTPVLVGDRIHAKDPVGEFDMVVTLIATRTFEGEETWKMYGHEDSDRGLSVWLEGHLNEYCERATE